VNLKEENSRYLLNEFLRNILHISDKQYQKRVWIRGDGPECQAFDDAVCDFFDIGEPIFDDHNSFGITGKQYRLLIQLRDAFREFSNHHDWPALFIDTPEWTRITEMAQEVLREFRYPKE
jgi:hypothetical protein